VKFIAMYIDDVLSSQLSKCHSTSDNMLDTCFEVCENSYLSVKVGIEYPVIGIMEVKRKHFFTV